MACIISAGTLQVEGQAGMRFSWVLSSHCCTRRVVLCDAHAVGSVVLPLLDYNTVVARI